MYPNLARLLIISALLAWGFGLVPGAAQAVPSVSTHVNPVSIEPPEYSINSSLAEWDLNSEYQAADDFRVPPAGAWWLVNQVKVYGRYNVVNATLVNAVVEFYYDSGANLPGARHSRQVVNASAITDISGTLTIPINTMAFAPGQRYWVSVQARMPNVQNSVWLWQVGVPTAPGMAGNGYDSVHFNGTTPTTCPRWTSRGAGGGQSCGDPTEWGASRTELRFELTYNEFTPSYFVYLPVVRR